MNPVINLRQEEQINSEIEILKSRSISEKVIDAIGPQAHLPEAGRAKLVFPVAILPSAGR